jgi:hypothetical protein
VEIFKKLIPSLYDAFRSSIHTHSSYIVVSNSSDSFIHLHLSFTLRIHSFAHLPTSSILIIMRFSTSSALAAISGISVSGNIILTQAASCNPEPISAGGDVSLEQLNSAIYKACAEWSKNSNAATTFSSALFKLSVAGPVKTIDNDACITAFTTIIQNCAGDVVFGGSTASQGVKYTIDGAGTHSELHSGVVARAKMLDEK